jgi:hypothetical protein
MRRALAAVAVILLTAGSSPATHRGKRHVFDAPAPACNSSNVGTYIGNGSSGNYAGASNSGVLAGLENGACDARDAIFGGYTNVIAGNGYATDSFIGSGTSNLIDDASSTAAANSFIGAGENGTVKAGNSALATGMQNTVAASEAFAGAGEGNIVGDGIGGGYAGAVAGYANSIDGFSAFVGAGYENTNGGNGGFSGAGGYEYFAGVAKSPNAITGEDAAVGSGDENVASGLQAFVGAGVDDMVSGADAFAGSGDQDSAKAAYSFVGAGVLNVASNNDAFAGTGYGNAAGGNSSFVGAGGSLYFSGQVKTANATSATAADAFLGAGDGNSIGSGAGFIGGGVGNAISGSSKGVNKTGDAAYGAIVGGLDNAIVSGSGIKVRYSFIGGGAKNVIQGSDAVIAGGDGNVASGLEATVPGGYANTASGAASFAAGTGSTASTIGSFVWSDAAGGATALKTTANDQFLARTSGGVKFYTNAALTSGVSLAAGAGAWASLSDRTMKTGIAPLDDRSVLERLARVPIAEWWYRSEDRRIRHIGPMAQDFYAAFHVGEDDRHISSIDEGGVALAALKAVHAETNVAREAIAHANERLSTMQRTNDALFAALEKSAGALGRRFSAAALVLGAAALAGPSTAAPIQPRHVRPHDSPQQYCNQSTVNTIIGGGYGNYTGDENTGVLEGEYNGACDGEDAVGAGYDNVVAGNGNASDGFIGGGQGNLVKNSTQNYSPDGFIGGGENNVVSVGDSGIVAGYGNTVSAGQAFIGAGQSNTVAAGATNAGVVAGLGNVASGVDSFVGAGYENTASGPGAFLGAGGYQYYQGTAKRGNVASGEDAFLGAGDENGANALQAFVGAGDANTVSAADAFVGAGNKNSASAGYAFVGAGNTNGATGNDAFVGAGYGNTANGICSFVGAGGTLYAENKVAFGNSISTIGADAFIGAGDGNTLSAQQAFIGGGVYNYLSVASNGPAVGAQLGAIVGGYNNQISALSANNVEYGFIGGGSQNSITGSYAVVSGGIINKASGVYSTVPGGSDNSATGAGSFAAGTNSVAHNTGTFVWGDTTNGGTSVESNGNNQFLVRASGGVKFFSNAALTSGVSLAPGSGTWASLSDRNMKTGIVPVNERAILDKVAALPVSEWSYRSEDSHVRHVGPMAQDFYAAFRVGEDDRHITTIDEDGVVLAAVKALHARNAAVRAANADLERRIAGLERAERSRIAVLAREFAALGR